MGKPILCLYRPQEGKLLSGMIRGNTHQIAVQFNFVHNFGKLTNSLTEIFIDFKNN